MDIIDQAFSSNQRPQHWSDLSRWLEKQAGRVNNVREVIEASNHAAQDGCAFPATAEEVKHILKKYRWTEGVLH